MNFSSSTMSTRGRSSLLLVIGCRRTWDVSGRDGKTLPERRERSAAFRCGALATALASLACRFREPAHLQPEGGRASVPAAHDAAVGTHPRALASRGADPARPRGVGRAGADLRRARRGRGQRSAGTRAEPHRRGGVAPAERDARARGEPRGRPGPGGGHDQSNAALRPALGLGACPPRRPAARDQARGRGRGRRARRRERGLRRALLPRAARDDIRVGRLHVGPASQAIKVDVRHDRRSRRLRTRWLRWPRGASRAPSTTGSANRSPR